MEDILKKLQKGDMSLKEARDEIEKRLFSEGIANIDPGRHDRTAVPEVILSEGKTDDQIVSIAREFLDRSGRAIISRLTPARADIIIDGISDIEAVIEDHSDTSGSLVVRKPGFEKPPFGGRIGLITAGTSDIRVIEEARIIAIEMGCETRSFFDVGVAGMHRLIVPLRELEDWGADVLVVAAGREGALPTLVSGLTRIPVIGLPVSVGYGIHPKGETALFAMLQSCSPLAVVNIDAGFVAGAIAGKIARRVYEQAGNKP
ncbi:MAG: nickel pincer cofactor biosynthesis protein LarB [Thermoplasmatota archaeon]